MTQQDRTAVQYHKMTETPIPRLILSLAAPTILSMLITSIYNLADTFFVGRISTSASGAVGVVSSLMAIIQALGFMLGHGSGTIISRRLGSQDTHAATRFASTSFFTSPSSIRAILTKSAKRFSATHGMNWNFHRYRLSAIRKILLPSIFCKSLALHTQVKIFFRAFRMQDILSVSQNHAKLIAGYCSLIPRSGNDSCSVPKRQMF